MWIDRQDFLCTVRSARRAPLLSGIAIVALSLGIGLNAGVFTLLNAMFLNPPTQKRALSFRPALSPIRRLVHWNRTVLVLHYRGLCCRSRACDDARRGRRMATGRQYLSRPTAAGAFRCCW